jgi:hypothetical protein
MLSTCEPLGENAHFKGYPTEFEKNVILFFPTLPFAAMTLHQSYIAYILGMTHSSLVKSWVNDIREYNILFLILHIEPPASPHGFLGVPPITS